MVGFGENHEAASVEVKIADAGGVRRAGGLAGVEFLNAARADAGAVAEVIRHQRQQFLRHFDLRAPAWTFVRVRRAKLAGIGPSTERAA
jgi:hypothetical protein